MLEISTGIMRLDIEKYIKQGKTTSIKKILEDRMKEREWEEYELYRECVIFKLLEGIVLGSGMNYKNIESNRIIKKYAEEIHNRYRYTYLEGYTNIEKAIKSINCEELYKEDSNEYHSEEKTLKYVSKILGSSELSDKDVRQISIYSMERKKYDKYETLLLIMMLRYGVTKEQIKSIIKRKEEVKNWEVSQIVKYVKDEYYNYIVEIIDLCMKNTDEDLMLEILKSMIEEIVMRSDGTKDWEKMDEITLPADIYNIYEYFHNERLSYIYNTVPAKIVGYMLDIDEIVSVDDQKDNVFMEIERNDDVKILKAMQERYNYTKEDYDKWDLSKRDPQIVKYIINLYETDELYND